MAQKPIDTPAVMLPSAVPVVPVVVVLPSTEGLAFLADDALIEIQRQAGAARRRVDAVNAAIAGEIARRSDRALGHQGLAARLGASTPEGAIQSLTGVTLADAKALTAVGAAVGAALGGALSGTGVGAAADVGSPWLAPVTNAVADGSLSVASAAAITRGLGVPTDTVAADDLLDAAIELVDLARESTPESAARSARIMRERLDVASIADLEAHRRSRRSLKWFEQPDGMTRMVALLDPESAAIITGAIDTVMSPRRGGPRFVDTEQASKAADMVDDPRTNDQFAVDTLIEIVNLATRAANCTIDQVNLFGDRSPAVRVHIQADTLRSTSGPGHAPAGTGAPGTAPGPGPLLLPAPLLIPMVATTLALAATPVPPTSRVRPDSSAPRPQKDTSAHREPCRSSSPAPPPSTPATPTGSTVHDNGSRSPPNGTDAPGPTAPAPLSWSKCTISTPSTAPTPHWATRSPCAASTTWNSTPTTGQITRDAADGTYWLSPAIDSPPPLTPSRTRRLRSKGPFASPTSTPP